MTQLHAELAKLHQQYRQRLPGEVAELRLLAEKLQGCETDRPHLEELYARLHKLVGSAGTFGFSRLSGHARELEQTLRAWLQGNLAQVDEIMRERFVQDLGALPLAGDAVQVFDPSAGTIPDQKQAGCEAVQVWLVDDDAALGEELSRLLMQFGYAVRLFVSLDHAERAALTDHPDLLVMDVVFPNGQQRNAIEEMQIRASFQALRCPIIFISAYTNFHFQIEAVRLGAKGFLTKPVDVPKLVDQMERILAERKGVTARILLVDDDELLREHYRRVLQAAGMEVEVLQRREAIIECMAAFHPELILMDVHMPDYSGVELAALIRYYDEWAGLPIVYLSTESDLDEQIKAMGCGADDFLSKPISDIRLVAAVKARAARSRQLSDLIFKDSLTGLYKHARIKEEIDLEMNRSLRNGAPLSLVMVDIDYFKKVNDTYGHVIGDRVIKAVANILKQRLRKSDVIGRYGGEEFLVIIPECEAEPARRIIDDIRQSFAALRFYYQNHEFSCSLSAGVACSKQYPGSDSTGLLAAADEALYRAKLNGRDRVCVADGELSVKPMV